MWVENPVINETEHTITFAGGLPGGYCGRVSGDPSLTNIIAEFVFRSPGFTIGAGDNPTAKVWVDPISQVLLNDGYGTKTGLQTQDATLSLLSTAGTTNTDTWRSRVSDDTVPPSDFAVTLSNDKNSFSGKYFISFNTQDKQSGVDHYEVMEEPLEDYNLFKWGRADAPWSIAESPYVLKDQTLNSTIRVRAIDKAGNQTIALLVPEESLRSISRNRLIEYSGITALVLIVIICIAFVILKRRKKLLTLKHDQDE
jgi:hypothetical protein